MAVHNACQRREMAVSTNNNRLVNGLVHNLLMQFFGPGSSKIEVFETCFFHIATTQNDHPRYVTHILGRVYMFLTLFGYWPQGGGGAPKRLVHNLLMQLFNPGSSKMEVLKLVFLIL